MKPAIILISGEPNVGKTTLAKHMKDTYKGVFVLHNDSIFNDYIFPNKPAEDIVKFANPEVEGKPVSYNIYEYVNSEDFDKKEYQQILSNALAHSLSNPLCSILLVEGYVAPYIGEVQEIFNKFGYEDQIGYVNVHPDKTVSFNGGNYEVDDWSEFAEKVYATNRAIVKAMVLPKIKYQLFDMLGMDVSASNSPEKWKRSKMQELCKDALVLDIGCNAGYFCFKSRLAGAKGVHGVDMEEKIIHLAEAINRHFFHLDNINFACDDVLTKIGYKLPGGFYDVIHCASTFHYFKDKQRGFLEMVSQMLKDEGTLVLEVELNTEGVDYVKRAREANGETEAPWFPCAEEFEKLISGLLTYELKTDSVFQNGSHFPRYYFHLKKCQE